MRHFTMTGLAVAAVATVLFTAVPAQARPQPQALTWRITPPANCAVGNPCDITATDVGPLVFTDNRTTTTVTCTGSMLQGFLLTGNNVGNPLGDILGPAATPFTGCTGGGFAFGTTGMFNWFVNGTSYANGVTTGQVWAINAEFFSGGANPCGFQVTGAASFTYANATGLLRFNPAVGLKDQLAISNVSPGCAGKFQNSPANTFTASFSGSYTVTWDSDGTHPQITAT